MRLHGLLDRGRAHPLRGSMDWSTECQARLWGVWNEDAETLIAMQRHVLGRARLLVTAEVVGVGESFKNATLETKLYVAPVPIRKSDECFGEPSIHNRDRAFDELGMWLKGYKDGRAARKVGP